MGFEIGKTGCDCPYVKSCHEMRQQIQVGIRTASGKPVMTCEFYQLLKPLYEARDLHSLTVGTRFKVKYRDLSGEIVWIDGQKQIQTKEALIPITEENRYQFEFVIVEN